MTKKILIGILTVGIIASLAGCGSIEENMADVASVQINEDTMEEGSINTTGVKEIAFGDKTEMVYNEEDYGEQKDIFVYKNIDSGNGTQIDFTNEEHVDGPFILSESIDIYSYFFTYAGYTKPDIKINSVGRIGDWIFIPFAQSSFLVKAEDFDRVAVLEEKETDLAENNTGTEMETVVAAQEKATPTKTEESANSNNEVASASETVPQAEESAPAVTTYSEEEVISIFRNTLENNGIQWYPDSAEYAQWPEAGPSGGMGWGIENISMTDPYGDAAKTVEGFKFGGWEYYYLESQGSSNGYVHLKLYSG